MVTFVRPCGNRTGGVFADIPLAADAVGVRIGACVVFSCCRSGHQLLKVDPKRSKYLACGLLLRGDVVISDVQRSIARIKREIQMVHWNQDGFKVGLCSVPPTGQVQHDDGVTCVWSHVLDSVDDIVTTVWGWHAVFWPRGLVL